MDLETILRWGWFFVLLEIPRFVILDGVFIIKHKIERRRDKGAWEKAKQELYRENPFVTVLVPGHNEGKHLFKLIHSINDQTFQNLELIVVDDGSTDDTKVIGRTFERLGFIDRFLRVEERGGKASAANLGLGYSKGKYIVHIDADSSLQPDAIERILLPFYRYKNIGAVGGNLKVRNKDQSLTTTMQYMEYQQSISMSRLVKSKLGIYMIVSGAFGAFPRTILNRVGGWDVGPGLDGDITVKIRKINYRILFEETAICETHVPITWKALAKQRMRWSRSLIRFRIRKHRDIWRPNKNFNLSNFYGFFENVLFALVLDVSWVYYTLKILLVAPSLILIWFPFKYFLYIQFSLIRYIYALWVGKNKKELLSKLIYIPLYPLYMGYFMRFVRTAAYFSEFFFFRSYKDTWNPTKTSRKARQFGA